MCKAGAYPRGRTPGGPCESLLFWHPRANSVNLAPQSPAWASMVPILACWFTYLFIFDTHLFSFFCPVFSSFFPFLLFSMPKVNPKICCKCLHKPICYYFLGLKLPQWGGLVPTYLMSDWGHIFCILTWLWSDLHVGSSPRPGTNMPSD